MPREIDQDKFARARARTHARTHTHTHIYEHFLQVNFKGKTGMNEYTNDHQIDYFAECTATKFQRLKYKMLTRILNIETAHY